MTSGRDVSTRERLADALDKAAIAVWSIAHRLRPVTPHPPDTPVMALREDDADQLDDVVVKDVTMFRAEMMSKDTLWLCCYFANGERVAFDVQPLRRTRGIHFHVIEEPREWVDFDLGEAA